MERLSKKELDLILDAGKICVINHKGNILFITRYKGVALQNRNKEELYVVFDALGYDTDIYTAAQIDILFLQNEERCDISMIDNNGIEVGLFFPDMELEDSGEIHAYVEDIDTIPEIKELRADEKIQNMLEGPGQLPQK